MLTSSIRLGLLALIISLFAPSAIAQDDAPTAAEQCIARIAHITESSVENSRSITQSTVNSIRVLDRQGAPNRVIIAAGHAGKEIVDHRKGNAAQRIRGLVDRCVTQLQADGAPPRVIRAVVQAGQVGVETIRQAAENAKSRISRAVTHATS